MGSSSEFAAAQIITPDVMPYDIERVEVLAGPQGTLYGANSMSGVVKYVLTPPDPTKFSAEAGADLFGIQDAGGVGEQSRVAVNLPVADELAVRGTFYQQFTPGYIDDTVTGTKDNNAVHQIGGRISLLWEPVSNLSLDATVLDQHVIQNNSDTVSYDPTTHNPAPARSDTVQQFLSARTDQYRDSALRPHGQVRFRLVEPHVGFELSNYPYDDDWGPHSRFQANRAAYRSS